MDETNNLQGNGGCHHHCENLEGGHECSCRAGFAMSGDGAPCVDVDECSADYYDCDQQCVLRQSRGISSAVLF